jgi:glycosyltransferase involved in cell wall biosynthesis
MNNFIYIVIRDYDENLAKRQPWYGVKKLVIDLKLRGCSVKIISNLSKIPNSYRGTVVKVLGLKDLFFRTDRGYRLVYFMSFPLYPFSKFFSFSPRVTIDNWRDLNRIFIASLLPMSLIVRQLKEAEHVVVISDRLEDYLSKYICVKKYIPFIKSNWNGADLKKNTIKKVKKIGYFGPPYSTRSFDDVINFFIWINENKYSFDKKIITRIEKESLRGIEQKFVATIVDDKNLEIVSGFLDRKALARELIDIDVLLLPFKIVMSELPIVVLEALELGIPVITTDDSGIQKIAKDQKNILILNNFKKDKYRKVVDFIESVKDDEFQNIETIIKNINKNTINLICQR